MRILMIVKYPPIQGGVSAECYWTAQLLTEMGHEVHVLTNADEVEPEYRILMSDEDKAISTGFIATGSIAVHTTTEDRRHVFIPKNNPSVSKLCSVGIEIIESVQPDLIWAQYLEPYGVVALMLSKLTGVPYVFRHAGSDIGRLMLTPQLERISHEVLRHARIIMTDQNHHERFMGLGVPGEKLVDAVSTRLRSEIFFSAPPHPNEEFTIGVYGKVGNTKGTGSLLVAMRLLGRNQYPIILRGHVGGRSMREYTSLVHALGDEGSVSIKGFIPHWRIGAFVRSCDAVLFLENRFSITFHHPCVPLEVMSCGRLLITTEEIANKPGYEDLLRDNEGVVLVEGDVTAQSVLNAICRAHKHHARTKVVPVPKTLACGDVPMRVRMNDLMETIACRL